MILRVFVICFFSYLISGCDNQPKDLLNHYKIIIDSSSHTIIKYDERDGRSWLLDDKVWKPISHSRDILSRLQQEKQRRSEIYRFLNQNSEARKIVEGYKKGLLDKSIARGKLENLLPVSFGGLPPDAEEGDWFGN